MKKVLVGGAFDLLHFGHLCMLKWAKAQGDYLIVHVNSDKRVHYKKGADRPIIPQCERISLLKELSCVDEIHTTERPYKSNSILVALRQIKPDIYARNKTANPDTLIQEQSLCQKLGIEMLFYSSFPHIGNIKHTTDIIRKIKGVENLENFILDI